MITSAPAIIILTVIVLAVTLVVFQQAVEDIIVKEEEIKKQQDVSERVSHIIQFAARPFVQLESCTKDTAYNYKFRVSSFEAYFQGLPGETREMPVFATLVFKDAVGRDTKNTVVSLKPGVTKAFEALEFDIRSGEAPIILSPDDTGFISTVIKDQPVVVNNYKITPYRQLKPLGININPFANCYTDFLVECRRESGRASLTSCKDNPNNLESCKSTLVVCGGRVDLALIEYKSGTCGSRPISLVVQTSKQAEGWEYADFALINFWRKEAAEKPAQTEKDGKIVEEYCWQEVGFASANCKDRFLGAYLFNLSAEKYNVGDKYNPKGCLWPV